LLVFASGKVVIARARTKWKLSGMMRSEDSLVVVSLHKACVGKLRVDGSRVSWLKDKSGYGIV
jgi:hypothetical protein